MKQLLFIQMCVLFILLSCSGAMGEDGHSTFPMAPEPDTCKVSFINMYPCPVQLLVYTRGMRKFVTRLEMKPMSQEEIELKFEHFWIMVIPAMDPVPRIYDFMFWRRYCWEPGTSLIDIDPGPGYSYRWTHYTRVHTFPLHPKPPTDLRIP